MRRTGGVIPPGKAGLVMIAVALVPVAIAAAKPLWKKIFKTAGDAAERVADCSQMAVEPEEAVSESVVPPKVKKDKKGKKSGKAADSAA